MKSFNIQQVDVDEILRCKKFPAFDFVEASIRSGRAYKIGEKGYALIGGESSLLPGFVVELSAPTLVPSANYDDLLQELNRISCGMIWFDSSDYDSYDIIWKHVLMATPCAVLFLDVGRDMRYRVDESMVIREVENDDLLSARELFLKMPADLGGESEAGLDSYMLHGRILGGYRNETLVASALVTRADEAITWVSAVAVPERLQGSGVGVRFMQCVLQNLRDRGQRAVGGVGRRNLFAYKTLKMLGLEPIKQSWMADFSRFQDDDRSPR